MLAGILVVCRCNYQEIASLALAMTATPNSSMKSRALAINSSISILPFNSKLFNKIIPELIT